MPKNVVVLMDGTGNDVATHPTNVLRLARIVSVDRQAQAFFYDPGVGTAGAPSADLMSRQELVKLLGLGIGTGVYDKIAAGYRAVIEAYEPGDRLFLFGFSRGAYVARALAGLIAKIGVLEQGRDNLVPYAIKLYADPKNIGLARAFSATFCDRQAKVNFLGLWDTVKSVFELQPGIGLTSVSLPRTYENDDVEVVRHAIALDERRRFYRTNVWGDGAGQTDVRQVWFAGVHSDIGGGYPDGEGQLSKIALDWMLREAVAHGLVVNDEQRRRFLGEAGSGKSRPDHLGDVHVSLGGWWRPLEWLPKYARRGPGADATSKLYIPRGEPRFVPDGALVHRSVEQRIAAGIGYRPPNLPSRFEVVD